MHNQIVMPPTAESGFGPPLARLHRRPGGAEPAARAPLAGAAQLSAAEQERMQRLARSYVGGSSADPDQELVARAQEGDMRAFELLLRKYQHRVLKLVSPMVGESDAADVAQETFIKAYRALPGFRGQSRFYTWLYRIGLNTARNHLAWRGRRPANQDIDISEAWLDHSGQLRDNETPESLALSDEIREHLAETIASLPSELRRAITLRELEGLSYEEIAQVVGCPIGTVRSRIFRAREAVDRAVGHLLN